ncbi:MAG: hypothetical protein NUV55_12605 [Sulfuricaulis sp.]|uniref:hypothetical protein n=1 Tax=Sulfuricaulis sp. TaxID=2003553 RepID=UPI0025F64F19|nr:hypothetical protein [Sulfuricaulis sp.]MCR4348022.1 hypothetical protein [Sulfuricaulis sp.]
MINIVVALISFFLGLIPLWQMYIWERSGGVPLARFTLVYFSIQHIAFGVGGSLIAIFDQNYTYLTLYGYFPYADGLARLQLINLIALYAALAGMWAIIVGRRTIGASLPGCSSGHLHDHLSAMPASQVQSLRMVCYVSLVFHMLIVSSQWYFTYSGTPTTDISRYLIQIGAKVAPVTFFILGLWWPHGHRERWIFVTYFLVYGILQLATGGRAPVLFAEFMFYAGLLMASPKWLMHPRRFVVAAIVALLIPWLAVKSEDVRLLYHSRVPAGVGDMYQRVVTLVGPKQIGVDDSGAVLYNPETLGRTIFRFGARITELSALDIVARTPEKFPYWSWSEADWLKLGWGWLPAFLIPDLPKDENSGVLFLRHYGWAVDPERGHSMPVTLLADSWRRFGWPGVIAVHFFLAAFLTTISTLMSRRFSVQMIVLSSALLYILTISYTDDILTWVTSLPRKAVVVLAYTALISAICLPMSTRWARVRAGPS